MAGLMEGVGRLCARFAWWVIAAWVLLAVILGAAVNLFGAQTDNDLSLPGTDSQRATDVLASGFPQQNGTGPIVFYTPDGTLLGAQHKPAGLGRRLIVGQVDHVFSALNPIYPGAVGRPDLQGSCDWILPVLLDIDSGLVDEDLAEEILDAARDPAEKAGIQVEAGGSIGSRLSEPATESSELVGAHGAMIILTVVLGSLVAMGLPIVVAVIALSCALSAIGLLGHVFGVPSIAPTVATMIAWVGIDYAPLSGDAPQRPAREQNGGSRLHRHGGGNVGQCRRVRGSHGDHCVAVSGARQHSISDGHWSGVGHRRRHRSFRCGHIAARPLVGGGRWHQPPRLADATSCCW